MPKIYSIDTSAFIHAWQRDYPPDVFPTVWDKLDELIESDRLLSSEEVLIELERGGDDLFRWAKDREQMFRQPNHTAQKIVSQIVNQWQSFLPDASNDGIWADPYVIALASVENGIVITGETRVGQNARKPKIPNICDDLKIPWSNLLGLLRSEGYNF